MSTVYISPEMLSLACFLFAVASGMFLLVSTVGFSLIPVLFDHKIDEMDSRLTDMKIAHTEAYQSWERASDFGIQGISSAESRKILEVLKAPKEAASIKQNEIASMQSYLVNIGEAIETIAIITDCPVPDLMRNPLKPGWEANIRELSAQRTTYFTKIAKNFFINVRQTQHEIQNLKIKRRY